LTSDDILVLPTEEKHPESFVEGSTYSITVNRYERDPAARKACIAHYGAECSVCGFDFEAFYGVIGEDFIHVHHLVELATIGGEYAVDPVNDLRPVCPNCHAMLHVERPAMGIEQLRAKIDAARP
jgi:5-methylcytosine-specific restriction protein A